MHEALNGILADASIAPQAIALLGHKLEPDHGHFLRSCLTSMWRASHGTDRRTSQDTRCGMSLKHFSRDSAGALPGALLRGLPGASAGPPLEALLTDVRASLGADIGTHFEGPYTWHAIRRRPSSNYAKSPSRVDPTYQRIRTCQRVTWYPLCQRHSHIQSFEPAVSHGAIAANKAHCKR